MDVDEPAAPTTDEVFKALADPTRRLLLDRLHERNGQTLGELCGHLDMARQSATQHLGILEAANLVTTVRQGRSKLHYLNPVPIHEISERWIDKFEQPRLGALSTGTRPAFVYVIYIEATPEVVWNALTDAELTGTYWGHSNVSDWQVGSTWEHRRIDGSGIADVVGRVELSDPPRRLVTTWASPEPDSDEGTSRATYDIEGDGKVVRLTVTHEGLDDQGRADVASGWPAVLSNLKSLLETGRTLPETPWEIPAG